MHYKAHHVTPVMDHPFNLHECTTIGTTLYRKINKPTGSEEKKIREWSHFTDRKSLNDWIYFKMHTFQKPIFKSQIPEIRSKGSSNTAGICRSHFLNVREASQKEQPNRSFHSTQTLYCSIYFLSQRITEIKTTVICSDKSTNMLLQHIFKRIRGTSYVNEN